MRACLALCVVSALVGAALADCTACIGGQCYRKHRLPFAPKHFMDIDRNTNTLYSYAEYTLSKCELYTKVCHSTTHTWDIDQLLVDQRTGDTYGVIDSADDMAEVLSKVNFVNNETLVLVDGDVTYATFKDKLYYATFGADGIYVIEDGESKLVDGTEIYFIFKFIVDSRDDIYFKINVNDTYIIKRVSKGVVDPSVHWGGDYILTQDREGNAVLIDGQSHFVYRANNGKLIEIGYIDDLKTDTPLFDANNNLIYRNELNNIHLKVDRDIGCTYYYSTLNNKMVIENTARTSHIEIATSDTSDTPDGDTGDNDDMSPSASAPGSAAASDGSGRRQSYVPILYYVLPSVLIITIIIIISVIWIHSGCVCKRNDF